ncbi:MAG: hypothetical protein ABR591_14625 [Candidatus Velthaea sp.]
MKLVLLPGWHESGDHMKTFVDGRRGHPAFAALGYDCAIFAQGKDPLRPRIDRFANFLDELKAQQPDAFPVVTVGYSAGGLINRGFLRAYPERKDDIFATIQIGAPNAGLIVEYFAAALRLMRVPDEVIDDIDVESPFMAWLNGTGGHWVPTERKNKQRWVLDKPPIVVPEGSRILHLVGTIPKYQHESDGVVMAQWATLYGYVPSVFIDDRMANHLNLGAVFNWVAFLARGFRMDDRVWRREVGIIDHYIKEQTAHESEPSRPAEARQSL